MYVYFGAEAHFSSVTTTFAPWILALPFFTVSSRVGIWIGAEVTVTPGSTSGLAIPSVATVLFSQAPA